MEDNKVSISKNGLLLVSIILLVSFFVGYKVYKHHLTIEENEQEKIDSLKTTIPVSSIVAVASESSLIDRDSLIESNNVKDKQNIQITVNVEKEKEIRIVEKKIIELKENEPLNSFSESQNKVEPIKKEKQFGAAIIGNSSSSSLISERNVSEAIPFISVRVHGNQEIKNGSNVFLEVASTIKVKDKILKKGTIIQSNALFDNGRVFMSVGAIKASIGDLEGPFNVYGTDKVRGIPYSSVHPIKKTLYLNDGLNYFVK